MILLICIIFIIALAIIFFVHKHNIFVDKHNNNTATPQRGLSFNKKDKDYNIIGGIGGIGFV